MAESTVYNEIIFDYAAMSAAVSQINKIANDFESAADTLKVDFATAITNWQGDSKDRMNEFVTISVYKYAHDSVPGIIKALASLLDANAKQMKDADAQIAQNIPTSLQ